MMDFTVVMLAGALQPSLLQHQLDTPPLCLPIRVGSTLLESWLASIAEVPGCDHLRIAVNTEADAQKIAAHADAIDLPVGAPRQISVIAEPASCRGTAGLARDLSRDSTARVVVVIEAHCLPPPSPEPVLRALDGRNNGAVGVGPDAEPAGIYAFDRAAMKPIPPIGYFDLKEQLLPALNRSGRRIVLAQIRERVIRIRDRSSYLESVKASRQRLGSAPHQLDPSLHANVSRSARVSGWCLVEPTAVIEDGAVVHDSVVLDGAVVGRRAVVSRSIVGPFATVSAETQILEQVIAGTGSVPLATNGDWELPSVVADL